MKEQSKPPCDNPIEVELGLQRDASLCRGFQGRVALEKLPGMHKLTKGFSCVSPALIEETS